MIQVAGEILPGARVLPPMEDGTPDEPPKKTSGSQRGVVGRFAALNRFIDVTARTLHTTEALVWLVLWRDAYGNRVQTTQESIGERIGVDVRTVRRAIAELERRGLVVVLVRGGPGRASVYRIHPTPKVADTRVRFSPRKMRTPVSK